MKMVTRLVLLFLLFPTMSRADALTDLRSALANLGATSPLRGSMDITSTTRSSESGNDDPGKVTIGFDVDDRGLHVVYPRPALAESFAEARAEALDPERTTPVRAGIRRVRPLQVADLIDGASSLTVLLTTAQVVDLKPTSYRGKPARLLSLKLNPRLPKAAAKRVKKLDSRLSLWLGEDGVPLAAELNESVKASFLLMSFEQEQKQVWTYARTGDRLVAVRYEESSKQDGFGQHSTTNSVYALRLE